jgi:hypothetical protein
MKCKNAETQGKCSQISRECKNGSDRTQGKNTGIRQNHLEIHNILEETQRNRDMENETRHLENIISSPSQRK